MYSVLRDAYQLLKVSAVSNKNFSPKYRILKPAFFQVQVHPVFSPPLSVSDIARRKPNLKVSLKFVNKRVHNVLFLEVLKIYSFL